MNDMKKEQEERDLVYNILLDIGAIKTCPYHDDYYINAGMEYAAVYARATNKYKDYYRVNEVPQHFRDMVKQVLDSASPTDKCPFCERANKE